MTGENGRLYRPNGRMLKASAGLSSEAHAYDGGAGSLCTIVTVVTSSQSKD